MSKTGTDFNGIFSQKYKLYGEMLYKIAFMYTKNASDTEDVLQDVFTKYFTLKKTFSYSEHEKAWFIRVTQNKSIDFLRKKSRSDCDFKEEFFKIFPEDKSEESLLIKDVREKLLLLDNKYKTVILLYYYYEYSTDEIARIIRISPSAVKKRLQRAREKLKTEMEDYKI